MKESLILINEKHQVYKDIWKKLSSDGKINIASKAQREVSYCNMIAKSKGIPERVPKDTIYDLCQFAAEELEKEYSSLKQALKTLKKNNRKPIKTA